MGEEQGGGKGRHATAEDREVSRVERGRGERSGFREGMHRIMCKGTKELLERIRGKNGERR